MARVGLCSGVYLTLSDKGWSVLCSGVYLILNGKGWFMFLCVSYIEWHWLVFALVCLVH